MSDFEPIFKYINKAQLKGCYTIEESADLYQLISQLNSNVLVNKQEFYDLKQEKDECLELLGKYKDAIDQLNENTKKNQFHYDLLKEEVAEKDQMIKTLENENDSLKQDLMDIVEGAETETVIVEEEEQVTTTAKKNSKKGKKKAQIMTPGVV